MKITALNLDIRWKSPEENINIIEEKLKDEPKKTRERKKADENKNDNLFRKYNEVQNKFIYEPEWIVETVQNKGFEIFDTACNPEFGESRIFFVLKKL